MPANPIIDLILLAIFIGLGWGAFALFRSVLRDRDDSGGPVQ